MAIGGTILQEVVKIRKTRREKKVVYTEKLQIDTLRKLLEKAKWTAFGTHHNFQQILKSENTIHTYQNSVPIFDYDTMYDAWWHRIVKDEENISWPGKIKYFALTSGTSGSPSKRVPVSMEMLHSIRQVGIRQMLYMYDMEMPKDFYTKQLLMVGGSAALNKVGTHFEGDLSGIMATQVPRWFYRFRKPRKKIASLKDWDAKLEAMTLAAPKWDIGIVGGVPAWVQLLFERIIDHYKLDHIQQMWPNLRIYVHGGVAFGPYRETMKRLFGREMIYLDTYLASEGFMAIQTPSTNGAMQLSLDSGIFFEFIPFNEENFTPEGKPKENARVISLYEVEEGVDYALLISTCAGAWRYMIGDTVRFTNAEKFEIIITGRTKHFLSLCGEHLSVDNMNTAIQLTAKELGIAITEFTVAGVPYDGLFAHHWYLGCEGMADKGRIKEVLDSHLKRLNDDYSTERAHALKEVIIDTLPLQTFYDWMECKGKLGGQAKFPRVLNKDQHDDWSQFIRK